VTTVCSTTTPAVAEVTLRLLQEIAGVVRPSAAGKQRYWLIAGFDGGLRWERWR